jgi:hypothetical protein
MFIKNFMIGFKMSILQEEGSNVQCYIFMVQSNLTFGWKFDVDGQNDPSIYMIYNPKDEIQLFSDLTVFMRFWLSINQSSVWRRVFLTE